MGGVQPAPWAATEPAPPPEPKRKTTAKRRPVQVRVNRALYLSALADAIKWQEYVQAGQDPESVAYERTAGLLKSYRQAYTAARAAQPSKRGARRKLTEDQARAAAAATRAGEPLSRVAAELGVDRATIRRAIGRLASE